MAWASWSRSVRAGAAARCQGTRETAALAEARQRVAAKQASTWSMWAASSNSVLSPLSWP
jgi:hypothetical protein